MAFWETVLGKYIMTMAIAAVPVVELRGAIPAGIAAGLDPWLACGAAIFGNLLPVPFIILLVRQVFDRLRKHAFFAPKIDALERRAHLKGRLVRKYRLLGLMLFVAIPLPGTGAWTGALVADVLDLRLRTALPAIALGVLIAGIITTTVTLQFPQRSAYGIHALLTDLCKTTGGVIPVFWQRQHHGKQPLGF